MKPDLSKSPFTIDGMLVYVERCPWIEEAHIEHGWTDSDGRQCYCISMTLGPGLSIEATAGKMLEVGEDFRSQSWWALHSGIPEDER